jgi:hypothetical protein
MLIFYFSLEYFKFIQSFRSFFNWVNVSIEGIIICECYEQVITIHTFYIERTTDICVNYLEYTCAPFGIFLYFLYEFSFYAFNALF